MAELVRVETLVYSGFLEEPLEGVTEGTIIERLVVADFNSTLERF